MTFDVFLSTPDVGELEQSYVLRALKSGWVAPAGPDLDEFEREMARRVGRRHAVGLSSGTAALHLALVSWGVGPGDVVPVATFTFAATANAIRYVGATPYFIDCDLDTGTMNPDVLERALRELKAGGARVPVVIPVDMLGRVADYPAIVEAMSHYPEARILSDAAEAVGSTREGRPAGSFGDAAVLSFNGNKVMTTSGGGMLVTDDDLLASHVRKLSTQAREAVGHYEHAEIGYNYRLSNVLAALGRAQLERLDLMIKQRRAWREQYRDAFAQLPGTRVLGGVADSEDNCWLTAVVIDPSPAGFTSRDLAVELAADRVETRPVWKPMHMQPVFAGMPSALTGAAESLFATGLTLPSGSAMSDDSFTRVLQGIRRVASR